MNNEVGRGRVCGEGECVSAGGVLAGGWYPPSTGFLRRLVGAGVPDRPWGEGEEEGDSPCSSGTLPTVAPADSRALFAHGNRGAFAHRCPSRFQRIFAAPKAGDCLEFTSLHLPQAALR